MPAVGPVAEHTVVASVVVLAVVPVALVVAPAVAPAVVAAVVAGKTLGHAIVAHVEHNCIEHMPDVVAPEVVAVVAIE